MLKDFQKDEGHDGYPLGTLLLMLVPGNIIKLGRV